MVSKLKSTVSKTWASGMNVVVVPRRPCAGPIGRTGTGRLAALVLLASRPCRRGRTRPQLLGERVDDADADAVEAAGHLVAAAAELAAGVEHRVDDLERVLAGLLLHAHRARRGRRRSCARCRRRRMRTSMLRGMAGHGLVDGVVDDLPDEVMQAADIGRADVHARPAPDRLEALEHLDGVRAVAGRLGRRTAARPPGAASGPAPSAVAAPSSRPSSSSSSAAHAVDQASQVVVVVPGDRDAASRRGRG